MSYSYSVSTVRILAVIMLTFTVTACRDLPERLDIDSLDGTDTDSNGSPSQCPSDSESSDCDDGNKCTVNDRCNGGICEGTPLDCKNDNNCTDDKCDPSNGCEYNPIDCDDKAPCTTDECDPALGCVFSHRSGSCDDNNECTQTDKCDEGKCVGTNEVPCNPSSDCQSTGTCNPSTGECAYENKAQGTECADDDQCTTNKTCNEDGVCVGTTAVDCDDNNECTNESCDPVEGCQHTALPANTPCDDGNKCTGNDQCDTLGQCQGKPKNIETLCSAAKGNPCAEEGTLGCNEDTGECQWTPAPEGLGCNDGNECTENDQCNKDGECKGIELTCDDSNPCTMDSCNPGTGCEYKWDGKVTECDDGYSCTTNDTCAVTGECQGQIDNTKCNQIDSSFCDGPWVCEPGTQGSNAEGCIQKDKAIPDDGIACTVDACDNAKGVFTYTPDDSLCEQPQNDPCSKAVCDKTKGCVTQKNGCQTVCQISGSEKDKFSCDLLLYAKNNQSNAQGSAAATLSFTVEYDAQKIGGFKILNDNHELEDFWPLNPSSHTSNITPKSFSQWSGSGAIQFYSATGIADFNVATSASNPNAKLVQFVGQLKETVPQEKATQLILNDIEAANVNSQALTTTVVFEENAIVTCLPLNCHNADCSESDPAKWPADGCGGKVDCLHCNAFTACPSPGTCPDSMEKSANYNKGDLNLDGKYDGTDIACYRDVLEKDDYTCGDVTWQKDHIDLNCDGKITGTDISRIVLNAQHYEFGSAPVWHLDYDSDYVYNECDTDTDGDGALDTCESANNTSIVDACETPNPPGDNCSCMCIGPGASTSTNKDCGD